MVGLSTELTIPFKQALAQGRESAMLETRGEEWRRTWNSDAYHYEMAFKGVFNQKFNTFLDERRKSKKVYALDLMSTPAMLTDLHIDGGVAVGLGNPPMDKYAEKMEKKNISYIPGNLLTRQPWNDIEKWKKENDVRGFDLITCRPDMQGGHINIHKDHIPMTAGTYFSLLNRAWNQLDSDGGVLLVEIPMLMYKNGISKEVIIEWLSRLSNQKIDFAYQQDMAFKLVKHPLSPANLPT
jgi:hypothetical protein